MVDEAVGAVTAELKRSGRWDDSIVVVTGDHGLRNNPGLGGLRTLQIWKDRPVWTEEEVRLLGRREGQFVPLMVHLPRQTGQVRFARPLSALVLHDLILEWCHGQLMELGALESWLAARSR